MWDGLDEQRGGACEVGSHGECGVALMLRDVGRARGGHKGGVGLAGRDWEWG